MFTIVREFLAVRVGLLGCTLGATLACTVIPAKAQGLQLGSVPDPALLLVSGASGDSGTALISSDGRYVLFASSAQNLVEIKTNSPVRSRVLRPLNTYLRDRTSFSTTLISVDTTGLGPGDDDSVPMAISTDNRYVLFESSAANLVPGDTNNASDVFVRDLHTGTTILASLNTNGFAANGLAQDSAMTPDGRFVVFTSTANDLVADDTNRLQDVFIRDLRDATTALVSPGAVFVTPYANSRRSESPVVSRDGRFVAFSSTATNLAPFVPNERGWSFYDFSEVYVRDVLKGTTIWASEGARTAVSAVTGQTNCFSVNPAISEDGQFVFYQACTNLSGPAVLIRYHVPSGVSSVIHTNTPNGSTSFTITPAGNRIAFESYPEGGYPTNICILVWDSGEGSFTMASTNLDDGMPELSSFFSPVISSSGRYVAFIGEESANDTNRVFGVHHLWVHDLECGTTVLVDDANGVGENWEYVSPSFDASARLLAFSAADGILVPRDHNRCFDVFVRDLESTTNELISAGHPLFASSVPDNSSALAPGSVSSDGQRFVFTSLAANMVGSDRPWNFDVFLRDLVAGTNVLISANTNGVPGNGTSTEAVLSADGRFVAFASSANDLVPGVTGSVFNVFVRDWQNGTTHLVSTNSVGERGANYPSTSVAISSDGRFILFIRGANDLPDVTRTNVATLFLRDFQSGKTHRLAPYQAYSASMTPDGRLVAFVASSTFPGRPDRLHLWDSFASAHVYTGRYSGLFQATLSPDGETVVCGTSTIVAGSTLHELRALAWAADTNWLIAACLLSPQAGLRFSSDGRFLAYAGKTSLSTSGRSQTFLYDFETQKNILISRSYFSGNEGNGDSNSPDISADGRFIAFRSKATDLVPGDDNSASDIFLYDRVSPSLTLLTASRSGERSANRVSANPVFSPDGKVLLFESCASDLLENATDLNSRADVIRYQIYSSGELPIFRASLASLAEGLLITWPVLPAKSYRVQFKNDLSDQVWEDLPQGVTILGRQGRFHQSAMTAQRFYRVVGF